MLATLAAGARRHERRPVSPPAPNLMEGIVKKPVLLLVCLSLLGTLIAGCDDGYIDLGGSLSGPTPTGTLSVTTSTTGADIDSDGYAVMVHNHRGQPIGVNATVTFPDVPAGTYSVELWYVASNCTVSGGNPRYVSVSQYHTARITFDITCSALTGSLDVSTS